MLRRSYEYFVQPEQRLKKVSRIAGNRIPVWPSCTTLRKPIFIIGNPRSGTSLFVRCFKKHPSVAEWSEAGTVWDTNYYDSEQNHRLSPENLTESNRRRIRNTFLTYTLLNRKERFVNKHPRNSLRIEFIKELFPGSVFVHIVRHPAGAVDSMVRRSQQPGRSSRPFGGFVRPRGWKTDDEMDPVTKFSRCWKKVNECVLAQMDGQCTTIRYEDFCDGPVSVIRSVHEDTGLDPADSPQQFSADIENKNGEAFSNRTEAELDKIWETTAEIAKEFGYSRTDHG